MDYRPYHYLLRKITHFAYVYNCIFVKLFHVKEKNVIEQCQFYSNVWPFQALYEFNRFTFLAKQFKNYYSCQASVSDNSDFMEFSCIASKYNFSIDDSKHCVKLKVWQFLEQSLGIVWLSKPLYLLSLLLFLHILSFMQLV